MFVSALDILTGALGVFIVLHFLNARLASAEVHPASPSVAQRVENKKMEKPRSNSQRRSALTEQHSVPKQEPMLTPVEKPRQEPALALPEPTRSSEKAEETSPSAPPQDPVVVDLMKQAKGDVTILLQQEGLAKQSVEFMLKQGNQVWKPGRAGKYQTDDFQYEKSLNYFYQARIKPGRYEVWVRVKKRTATSSPQPFALYGKILQPGYRSITYNFGSYAISSTEWIPAGTLQVLNNALDYQSILLPTNNTRSNNEKATLPPPALSVPTSDSLSRSPSKSKGKWSR